MLYVFSADEQLLAVLSNQGGMVAGESLQYDSGLLYDSGLYYKMWTAENLCPYFDAVHTEGLDGTNIFIFSVPADHPDASYVVRGGLVAFKDLDGDWQLFEINYVENKHASELIKVAQCEHIAIAELNDTHIDDNRPTNATALEALNTALAGTRWQAGNTDDLGLNSTTIYRTTRLACVVKIAQVWGGEYKFRVTIAGNQITGRYVDLKLRRGTNTGKRFEYGKDLTEIVRTEDVRGIKTALYGYGKGEETADGFGRRITFADVVWTTPTNPANKPAGQTWVGDPDALAAWGRPDGSGGLIHRYGQFEDADETDPATLLQKTWDALQKQKEPLVNYSMSALELERISGLAHEAVRLGDTVACIDTTFKPVLRVTARVIEIKRNLLEPEKTNIQLGNFLPALDSDSAKLQNIYDRFNTRQGAWDDKFSYRTGVPTSVLYGVIDALRNEIQSVNGYVTITDTDGILILDAPTEAQATKAMRLKGGIFAIANSKTGGVWNWNTFGTGDGFVANLITSGTMLADRIFGGMLTLGGFNNENGVLRILDSLGSAKITGNQDGITAHNSNFLIADDLSQTPMQLTPSANLLRDPSFEALQAGDPDPSIIYTNKVVVSAYSGNISNYWSASNQANARILTPEGSDGSGYTISAYHGGQAVVLGSSAWNSWSQLVGLIAGDYFTASGYFSAFQATAGNDNVHMVLQAYNSATLVYTTIAEGYFPIVAAEINQYKFYSVTAPKSLLPAGTDYLNVVLTTQNGNYVLCDAVCLSATAYPVPFNALTEVAGYMPSPYGEPRSLVATDDWGKIHTSGMISNNEPAITLKGVSSAIYGAPPSPLSSGLFKIQAGTTVVTYVTGGVNINFPSAFNAGVITVVANVGGGSLNYVASIVEGYNMPGGFKFVAFSGGTEYPNGATIRIDWIAIGW